MKRRSPQPTFIHFKISATSSLGFLLLHEVGTFSLVSKSSDRNESLGPKTLTPSFL